MEDERKSSRMRGWNGCTHKEGKLWENDGREGVGGCSGGGGDDQGSCILSSLKIASLSLLHLEDLSAINYLQFMYVLVDIQ